MNNLHKEIIDAKKRISEYIKETKLIKSNFLSDEYNNEVYLKPENLQKTGAFKVRGALNKILLLSKNERSKGLIASSAGNHAQGVALAAQLVGAEATIIMPDTTPLIKVDATKAYGAEVILFGENYDESYKRAIELEKERGLLFIHPFDDEEVIAGQGTIGLEMLDDLADPDIVLVPIGGGGLAAGIAAAIKEINPATRVIGVEPCGAACMKMALQKGEVIELKSSDTIADGAAVKIAGKKPLAILQNYIDEIITVEDSQIMEAVLLLLEKEKIVSETAGALSVAALNHINVKNKKVISLISGGNIDVLTISEMIKKGLLTRGRIFCFSVELVHKPGELLKIATILADLSANVVKLEHNQFKSMNRFKNVFLEVTVETNGHDHIEQITQALENEGYSISKEY